MTKEKLYIVMPAYNEEANIEDVVKSWYPILENASEDSRIVIADSGSIDSTNKILKKIKKEYKKIEVLSDTLKQHGPKLIALYDYAIKNDADWIFQTDSDGQTNPDEFKKFWNKRKKYDAILGYRTVRQDGKSRKIVEQVLCFILRIIFGVKVPDSNAPFRLMKTSVVKKYLYKMEKDYNLTNVMLTTYFAKYNEKLLFEEISFKPRQGGKNSINIPKIIKIGIKALKDFKNFKKDMKRNEKSTRNNQQE